MTTVVKQVWNGLVSPNRYVASKEYERLEGWEAGTIAAREEQERGLARRVQDV